MLKMKIIDGENISLEPLSEYSETRLRIQWLGQAGFLIDSKLGRIIIDPYLSDSLAVKYRGKRFEHVRMMPIPVNPAGRFRQDMPVYAPPYRPYDESTNRAIATRNPIAFWSCRLRAAIFQVERIQKEHRRRGRLLSH